MTDTISARTILVLADCHIHPGGGVSFSPEALKALAGADHFITLGDMGERSGLEMLCTIAPVIGVRGGDDEEDARTSPKLRTIEANGVRIGCVFDPVSTKLVAQKAPLGPALEGALEHSFGGAVDVVLWASTHVPALEQRAGQLWINPGSLTLPDKGAPKSFACLTLERGKAKGSLVAI